jgi:hypothetical protein
MWCIYRFCLFALLFAGNVMVLSIVVLHTVTLKIEDKPKLVRMCK